MDVKLPHLGEGADSGIVVNVFVKAGDLITKDQPLLELENEKAVATIPSSAAGTVTTVFVKPGDKLGVGQKILSLSGGDEAPAEPAPPPAKSRPRAAAAEIVPAETAELLETEHPDTAERSGVMPAASPTIRRLARDLGIDLSRVRGTARGGRIEMADLHAYLQRLQKLDAQSKSPAAARVPAPPESIDFSKWGPVTRKPLSPLRQVIARRMAANWITVPRVTQFDKADITGLLELRKKHAAACERRGAHLTVTSFVVKAVAETLKQHPIFNSSLDEAAQVIVFKSYYHIGIAVDTEAGLIVPVVRDADRKDLVCISKDLEELAMKARERKVTPDELKGGTFTISNQGSIGGAHFTPIVNHPEVAILGLGRAAAEPVARGGKIEIRTLLPLALSYDHRVIDGGAAARFIVDLVKALEHWKDGVLE